MLNTKTVKINLLQDYIFYLPFLMLLVASVFAYYKYYVDLNYFIYTDTKCVPGEGICFLSESDYFFQEVELYAADVRDYCLDLNKEDCIGLLIKNGGANVISCSTDDFDCY